MTTLEMGAIVRGKHDQGVLGLAGFFQQLKQLADLVVKVFHHAGVASDWVYHIGAGLTRAGTVSADLLLKLRVDFAILVMQFLR